MHVPLMWHETPNFLRYYTLIATARPTCWSDEITDRGQRCCVAGEEGDPQNVWDTILELKVKRIDHGVTSINDSKLITYLENTQMPLDVCPLSNQQVCSQPLPYCKF